VPKLPANLSKRGQSYYFRQMVNGRVIKRSLGTNYQLALTRLRSLKSEGLPSQLTLEEAAQQWLTSYVPVQRKDVTLAAQRVRDYLVPCLGHFILGRLSREDCRAYRLWLEKRGKSPQTVRHILSDLRCLLNWCADSGLLDHSPFPRKILPRVQERPPDRLSDDELAAVCSLPDLYGFVCRLLGSTGLRWGEAVRAQASDIQHGMLLVHQTKSGKVRRVPIPEEFRGRVGRLVPFTSHGAFSRQVTRLAGVRFHVHQLRHTFACRWLERGGSLAALQELLGHSTVVTTQRYGRLAEPHVLAEAARVGRLVPEVVPGEIEQNA
jgi:integrase